MTRVDKFDLEWLIGKDFSKEKFLSDYFEKQPLHIKKAVSLKFDIKRFEEILWRFENELGDRLRVNKGGNPTIVPYLKLGAELCHWAIERYAEGNTLILNGLHELDTDLAKISSNLQLDFGRKASVNGFLTPPSSQGFQEHFDSHDVFLFQTSGKKHWKIYDSEVYLPLPRQQRHVDFDNSSKPIIDVVLEKGDILYIPRGFVHSGSTNSKDYSLHLTIGVRPTLNLDIVTSLMEEIAIKEPKLRESLLLNNREDIIEVIQRNLNSINLWKKATNRHKINSIGEARSGVINRVNSLAKIENINIKTSFRKGKTTNFEIVDFDDKIGLVFSIGKSRDKNNELNPASVLFPGSNYGILNLIRKTDRPISLEEISKNYDIDECKKLFKILVRRGFLEIVD
ncbi:cupin domain-containing protein [Tenacibaculum aiptasiae]|uniref:cupin domain-containing protein n=1 Tax=Tenacibaculum aiptasiae TaxID=426481 RepID=UPI003B5CC828